MFYDFEKELQEKENYEYVLADRFRDLRHERDALLNKIGDRERIINYWTYYKDQRFNPANPNL
jgi:hypothetical protein